MRTITLHVANDKAESVLLEAIASIEGIEIQSEFDEFVEWKDMSKDEKASLSAAYASTLAGRVHSWDEVEKDLEKIIAP